MDTLVNRAIEQGLPSYLLAELDLVVFPRHVGDRRYVGEVVEFLSEEAAADCGGVGGTIEKGEQAIHWNRVLGRTHGGDWTFAYEHSRLDGDGHGRRLDHRFFHRIADLTDRPIDAVEDEFHRKHRYAQYMVQEDMTDFPALFEFLSDLRNDETATVERIREQRR